MEKRRQRERERENSLGKKRYMYRQNEVLVKRPRKKERERERERDRHMFPPFFSSLLFSSHSSLSLPVLSPPDNTILVAFVMTHMYNM
jgi:hypothetical protein